MFDRTHLGAGSDPPPMPTLPDSNMPQPASNWSRSYQNPVGSVYYSPSESDDRWAWPPAAGGQAPGPQESPKGVTPNNTPPVMYSNYYGMFRQQDQPRFYDARPQPVGLGSYLPKPAKITPLGVFLPMPSSPYGGVSPQGSQNFDISPKSRRSAKSQRPFSADVNQLFAVEEDERSNHSGGSAFKKGIFLTASISQK
jgi:hypothetical protein